MLILGVFSGFLHSVSSDSKLIKHNDTGILTRAVSEKLCHHLGPECFAVIPSHHLYDAFKGKIHERKLRYSPLFNQRVWSVKN